MERLKVYESVWDAIEDDPGERQCMKMRSELMAILTQLILEEGLARKEAAKRLGVTQPQVSKLVHGKINELGLDMLVKMATAAGLHVTMRIKRAA